MVESRKGSESMSLTSEVILALFLTIYFIDSFLVRKELRSLREEVNQLKYKKVYKHLRELEKQKEEQDK